MAINDSGVESSARPARAENKRREGSGRETQEPKSLEDLLDKLEHCPGDEDGRVSVEQILDAVGRRSFGPLLLLAGLLGMTPVSAIPGAPSVIAVIVLLISLQLLSGRKSFWLPGFMLRAKVAAEKLQKTTRVARKPASFVDRIVKPRLQGLTRPFADRLVAGVCFLLAAMTPPLELLPLAAFVPSAAIAMFGLALIARDGLLVLIGLAVASAVFGLGVQALLD